MTVNKVDNKNKDLVILVEDVVELQVRTLTLIETFSIIRKGLW